VNEQIKKRALDIAKEGFRVFVPDLYRGVVTDKQEHAAHLLTGLDWPGAIQDITAAAKFARSQGACGRGRGARGAGAGAGRGAGRGARCG
jgi:carboxymethylenebutenolidase